MLSLTTILGIYICVSNPIIPYSVYKVTKFTFIKTKILFKNNSSLSNDKSKPDGHC